MTSEEMIEMRLLARDQFGCERNMMPSDLFEAILQEYETWPCGYHPADDVYWCVGNYILDIGPTRRDIPPDRPTIDATPDVEGRHG